MGRTPPMHARSVVRDPEKADAFVDACAPAENCLPRSGAGHLSRPTGMHSKAGEPAVRIVQLGAWAQSKHFYTVKELAAIELTRAHERIRQG